MPYQGLDVVDFHVHLPVPFQSSGGGPRSGGAARSAADAANQDYGRRRREAWRLEWNLPEAEDISHLTPGEVAARWAAEVDKYGLKRVVLVTGGGNETLAGLVRSYPDKFVGFCHHDLAAPDALDRLKKGVEELGLSGYKLLAPRVSIRWDDPSLEPLWAYAEKKQLPFLIHFGWLGTGGGIVDHPLISPLSIYPVARAHPGIPFVVAHFGCGYFGDLLQLCWSCENVYADTSGSNQWIRWMPYNLTLEDLFRKTYETIGPRRVIFGTDSSWFPRGFSHRYLEEQVRVCRWLGMKEADIALIFGGNASRLLHLT